ncbi:MAG: LamG domain-containing protein, partial [Actinomycetota bacterium]|nr:LamG domain-containing protein [Actinomycetota bacterium]
LPAPPEMLHAVTMAKRLLLAAIPVALILGTTPALASAPTGATPRVLFRAAEDSGRIAVDSSALGNDGRLLSNVSRVGGAYRFHPGVPRDRIRVKSHPSLNPGSEPFSYGAAVRVLPGAVWEHRGMAVVRHGDKDTPGGDYKLQLWRTSPDTAAAFCAMHDGSGGSGFVQGDGRLTTIDDGQWHTITCSRDPSAQTVSLTIDGFTVSRPDNDLGSIVGYDPLLIGTQPRNNGIGTREQFVGRMDNIRLAVGPLAAAVS